ncbi:hypothetical protein TNCV_4720811 [Trichonephila clavipes]|uniref:Uncharacterized protein n=1 Tax=Trichonephila clavipes TaxID=2585209 RepID=A0A8X7BF42_TRICX|nr:hypothetical protein TNCV_4720811 [Trichonephila clavipes]
MAHICGGGSRARLWVLLECTQHMLFKFRYPRIPSTLCVGHSSDKRTGFSETSIYMRAFGDGPRHFEPWSSDVDDT